MSTTRIYQRGQRLFCKRRLFITFCNISLGIGIDDMFVIVQCWMNLDSQGRLTGLPLAEVMGLTFRHAGVAVTITTATDVLAFAVGSVTKMPGLEAFCVTTSIALAAIYFLVVSFVILLSEIFMNDT
jgi:Niemann-Pick C1 protein